ncbi:MAG: 5-formyltetrahydrofolate cyclo-ligase [Burkholderiaceae bacterium]|nr:5-formyltetrahydrofolate cyclo-ligase [Burkholderiaceae bacterium]MCD8517935.1 5-formyltetrahydrofolate cyclo-ligase [Burkholderiaceae bacterium]MCD8536553.1 5-formyltetrahydrofolate cyclo-ligase [Burkholderiaceae bacterium]MCD8565326.1 5-formyltetrahydrofolate cyclo-ligase [Burkholderiaceae bacterium]
MSQNNADHLRTRLKQARKAMPVADRQRASLLMRARLFTWLATTQTACEQSGQHSPNIVAGFWPLADEPDLVALYRQWHDNGVVVALPVMRKHEQSLEFHRWQPDAEMVSAGFGVLEPSPNEPLTPDVVLVPTLGFTPNADRLGYGKGFYDRTLAELTKNRHRPRTIGVAWDNANLLDLDPDYQPADHDHPLDAIITPTTWYPKAPGWRDTSLG